MKRTLGALAALAAGLCPAFAGAQEIDSGATAWMLTSTALVLLMTLPGLALFYGGLVRTRNVLSVLMQCFALCCVIIADLGRVRLFAGVRYGLRPHRRLVEDVARRRRGRFGQRHYPRDRVLDVPADVRDHHAGADHRRIRGAHSLRGNDVVLDPLARRRLLARSPLGLGRMAGCSARLPRLRGRRRRARECRRRRARRGARHRQSHGVSEHGDAAAQPDDDRDRRFGCCGSAGSASTPAARSRRMVLREWRCS